ncbi:ABC-three component system middle component 6 [Corynebacterium callunae]|uniref:ABC-three component system middle component 6 n=1 Tax=Corynebacterium callunae TaxID=1721 RepID=UPI003CD0D0C1
MFPDKFTPLDRTVIGEAAALLELLGKRSVSVGQLYGEFRQAVPTSTYDSFAIALTFLYGVGILADYHNQIARVS